MSLGVRILQHLTQWGRDLESRHRSLTVVLKEAPRDVGGNEEGALGY